MFCHFSLKAPEQQQRLSELRLLQLLRIHKLFNMMEVY